MEMMIILDESGAMHMPNERYFVIAGFITTDVQKAISLQMNMELEIHKNAERNPKTAREIKGTNITIKQRVDFLNAYYENAFIKPIAIVIDKNKIIKKLHENTGFNFYTGVLLRDLVRNNIVPRNVGCIHFRTDQRTIKANHLRDFEAQMSHYLVEMNIDCETSYKQRTSSSHADARIADIISNSIWGYFHEIKNVKRRTDAEASIPDNIHIVKFPYDKFGK